MKRNVIAARLDVLGVALQEVCRALAPGQAAHVHAGLINRAGGLAEGHLSPVEDGAVVAELVPLLRALEKHRGARAATND